MTDIRHPLSYNCSSDALVIFTSYSSCNCSCDITKVQAAITFATSHREAAGSMSVLQFVDLLTWYTAGLVITCASLMLHFELHSARPSKISRDCQTRFSLISSRVLSFFLAHHLFKRLTFWQFPAH